MHHPIRVVHGRLYEIYLVNITFNLIDGLHLHGMFFTVNRTSTTTASGIAALLALCQGERAVLETSIEYPGDFMFHAHQSELRDWAGWACSAPWRRVVTLEASGTPAADRCPSASSYFPHHVRLVGAACTGCAAHLDRSQRSGPTSVRGAAFPPVQNCRFQRSRAAAPTASRWTSSTTAPTPPPSPQVVMWRHVLGVYRGVLDDAVAPWRPVEDSVPLGARRDPRRAP